MPDNLKTSLSVNKAFLFFFASTYVLRIIFSSAYFKQLGLSSSQTGVLQGASPISKAFGAFTFGYAADRSNSHKAIFLVSVFACALTPFLLTLPQPKEHHCVHHSPRSLQIFHKTRRAAINPWINNSNSAFKNRLISHFDGFRHSFKIKIFNDTVAPHRNNFSSKWKVVKRLKSPNVSERLMHNVKQKGKTIHDTRISRVQLFRSNRSAQPSVGDLRRVRHRTLYDTKSFHKHHAISYFSVDGDMEDLFAFLLLIIIIGDFISGPALNLSDTSIMHLLQEDKEQYGKVRLWGDLGQMVLVPSVAITVYCQKVEICGIQIDNYIIPLYVVSTGMVVAFLVGLKVKMPSSKQLSARTGDDADRMNTHEFLKSLFSSLDNWSLLTDAFFLGVFISSIQTFLFWTMIDLDPSQASLSVGVANFFRNIFSTLAYCVSTMLLQKIGTRNVINLSISIYFISFVIVAFFRNPWLAILPEILAYVALAFSMSACVLHVGKIAPEKWSGTAQGILQFLYSGIGQGVGPLLTGVVMDYLGQEQTYLLFAGLALLVLLFSVVAQLMVETKLD